MTLICPACEGVPVDEPISAREMFFGTREPFTYRRCSKCGTLWIDSVPDDLAPHYGDGYYMPAPPAQAGPLAKQRAAAFLRLPATVAWRLFLAARGRGLPIAPFYSGLGLTQASKIGDVGAGKGGLLGELQASGFTNLWGFDPFGATDSDEGGIHFRRATIHGVEGGFDLLMFNHSLEHVPDPVGDLVAARSKLAPGGHVLVRVPIAGSYADRTYGIDWVALDAPRHLWIPSEQGMRRAAERAGFEVSRVDYDAKPMQLWASEQYRQGIPLRAENSYAMSPSQSPFTEAQIEAFAARTRALNAARDGDAAGFVLRPR